MIPRQKIYSIDFPKVPLSPLFPPGNPASSRSGIPFFLLFFFGSFSVDGRTGEVGPGGGGGGATEGKMKEVDEGKNYKTESEFIIRPNKWRHFSKLNQMDISDSCRNQTH